MSEPPPDFLEQLAAESPAARTTLGILAHLDAAPIPVIDLFEAGTLPDGAKEAIAALGEHDLLEAGREDISMRPEAAALIRATLADSELRTGATAAIELLLELFPDESDNFDNWKRCEVLRPHARKALDRANELGIGGGAAVQLLDRVALYLYDTGRILEAHELAERARIELESGEESPEVAASVHRTLGYVLHDLDEYEPAGEEISQALELHLQVFEDWHSEVRKDRIALAGICVELEELDDAKGFAERALEDLGERPVDRTACAVQRALAWILLKRESNEQSKMHFERAIEATEQVMGAAHPDTAMARTGFGVLLYETGELDRSLAEQERALAVAESTLPEGHPNLAVIRSNLADSLRALGRRIEARRQLELALEAAEKSFPPAHSTIWIRLRKLGSLLEVLNENEEALRHAERALAISEEVLGPDDLRVAQDLSLVARIESVLSGPEKGRDRYRDAYEIAHRHLNADSPLLARYLIALGDASKRLGELHVARDCYGRALQILERGKDSERSAYLNCRVDMAKLLWELGEEGVAACSALGRDSDAQRLRERCEEVVGAELEKVVSERDGEASAAAAEVCLTWLPELAWGALSAAQEIWSEEEPERTSLRFRVGAAWQHFGRIWMQGDPELAEFALSTGLPLLEGDAGFQGLGLHALGEIRHSQGDPKRAAELYQEAADRKREAGEPALNLGGTLMALGRALKTVGEQGKALQAFEERLDILRAQDERDRLAEGVVLHEMAEVTRLLGEEDRGRALMEEAVELEREGVDSDAALVISLLELGRARQKSGDLEGGLQAYRERLAILASQAERDLQAEGVTLHDIADVRRRQGRPEEALELYREAADRKRDADENPGDLAVTLLFLARTQQGQGDYQGAIETLEERLDLLRGLEHRNPLWEAVTLHHMAEAWRSKEKIDQAIATFAEAAGLERQAGDLRTLAITLLELGRTLLKAGDNVGALAAYEGRLEVLEAVEERDPQGEGVTLHDIADLYREQGTLGKAAELYAQAADRKREAGHHPRDLATTLLELGRAREQCEEDDEAMKAYEERLAILRNLDDREPQAEGVTLHDLADLQRSLGNTEKALELYREAADLKREAGENPHDLGMTLYQVAGLELELEEAEQAMEAALEAVEHLRSLRRPPEELQEILEMISRTAVKLGRTEEAERARKQLTELADPS